jgi:hypothetical protein
MRTEYDDDEPAPLPPGQKYTKAQRRAFASRKARKVQCRHCQHCVPDHQVIAGIDRVAGLWWCSVCNDKCRKETNA